VSFSVELKKVCAALDTVKIIGVNQHISGFCVSYLFLNSTSAQEGHLISARHVVRKETFNKQIMQINKRKNML
jgi:hypothetical protein